MKNENRLIWIVAITFLVLIIPIFIFPVIHGVLGVLVKFFLLLGLGGYIAFLILSRPEISSREYAEEEEKPPLEIKEELLQEYLDSSYDVEGSFQRFMEYVLKLLQQSVIGQSAFFYLYHPEERILKLEQYSSTSSMSLKKVIPLEHGYLSTVLQESVAMNWGNIGIGGPEVEYYEVPSRVRSCLCAPVVYGQQAIGVLGIDDPGEDSYGEEDLKTIENFAQLVSMVIQTLEQFDNLKARSEFFLQLCDLLASTSMAEDIEGLCSNFAEFIRTYVPYMKFSYCTLSEENPGEIQFLFVDGYSEDYATGSSVVGRTVLDEIIEKGSDNVILNYRDLKYRFKEGDLDLERFQAVCAFVIRLDTRVDGVLLIENDQEYKPSQVSMLQLFGKHFTIILNRLLLFKTMRRLATIDGLTGVYNHRAFKTRFLEEIQRAHRYNTPLTLLILDLDKFKRINDTYGHLFGDFVLKKTVQIIKMSVRNIDTVARYGGEEFAVILINANKENSLNTAKRILNNIADYKYQQGDISERMTISIGMAEYPVDGTTIEELIENADTAMYAAKRKGGNTVVAFDAKMNGEGEK